jgi:phenylpropionate dioxygenase-like ring-hydroxylating dioxygenase large terminal subunit
MGVVRNPRDLEHPEAITYQEILDQDVNPPPATLRERSVPDLGTAPVDVRHYIDPLFFAASIEKMWLRTWLMACREEEIPNVGDFHIFEIVGKSLIVVRTSPTEIKALANVCLHRGRKLVQSDGNRTEFKCQFHGFTWNRDGSFARNPMEWDFPQCTKANMQLPEVQVGRWGGFVFVNFDKQAAPLEAVLEPIPRHFERWDLENRYTSAHVIKRVSANWMLVAEAFMESHHSITTHPQILPFVGDANAQYDVFSDHVSRHISSRGYSSPFAETAYSQHEIANAMLNTGGRGRIGGPAGEQAAAAMPDGVRARSYVADVMRNVVQAETGLDLRQAGESELGDSLLHNVFPNFSVWGGFIPNLIYRWLPDGKRHDSTWMEIRILRAAPVGMPKPPPATRRVLGEDETWASATELGGLGAVVDQDWGNLPYVQEGLETGAISHVHFGRYSEMRIRQSHLTLDKYMAR